MLRRVQVFGVGYLADAQKHQQMQLQFPQSILKLFTVIYKTVYSLESNEGNGSWK